MDVVVTKWAALKGTAFMIEDQIESLLKRFPSWLIQEARLFAEYLDTSREENIAREYGIHTIHKVGDNGIFGALWDAAEAADVGLNVDLQKIPIRQESIEIFNYLDENPYESSSAGMLLIFCENGLELKKRFDEADILASVIGKTTDKNDRIVTNKDRIRFLTPNR